MSANREQPKRKSDPRTKLSYSILVKAKGLFHFFVERVGQKQPAPATNSSLVKVFTSGIKVAEQHLVGNPARTLKSIRDAARQFRLSLPMTRLQHRNEFALEIRSAGS
jgi:hypothetical protein